MAAGDDEVGEADAAQVIELQAFGFGQDMAKFAGGLNHAHIFHVDAFQEAQVAFQLVDDIADGDLLRRSGQFNSTPCPANSPQKPVPDQLLDRLGDVVA